MEDIKTKQQMINEYIFADISRMVEKLRALRTIIPANLSDDETYRLYVELKLVSSNAEFLANCIEDGKVSIKKEG